MRTNGNEQKYYRLSTIERFLHEQGNLVRGMSDEGGRILQQEVSLSIHFVDLPLTLALGFQQVLSEPETKEGVYQLIYVHPTLESQWEQATAFSFPETDPSHPSSQSLSPQSVLLLALQHIRASVRQARALVEQAFEQSTAVYWNVPTVERSEEIWDVFHPLMTIGDRLEIVQRELELVEIGYQQFIASYQAQEEGTAKPLLSLQETFVDPAQRQAIQQLPFVVHVTVGTRFGRPLSAQELQERMERYGGQCIEQNVSEVQGAKRSVVSFFADLRDVAPLVATDLSDDAIGLYTIRKPSIREYTAALRFLHQRTAEQGRREIRL